MKKLIENLCYADRNEHSQGTLKLKLENLNLNLMEDQSLDHPYT